MSAHSYTVRTELLVVVTNLIDIQALRGTAAHCSPEHLIMQGLVASAIWGLTAMDWKSRSSLWKDRNPYKVMHLNI
jgi:hypothetical protein